MISSSSLYHLDMHTLTYATPTLITEALRLVTRVQLLLTTVIVLMPYTALANSYGVSIYDTYQLQGHTH